MNVCIVRLAFTSLLWMLASLTRAAPLLSAENNATLAGICNAGGPGFSSSAQQTGILLYDTNGSIAPVHDELSSNLRADTVASTGLVMCLTPVEVVLETCQFNVFFSTPRIRQDYQIALRAARDPARLILATTLEGTAPETCAQSGQLSADSSGIKGALPGAAMLESLLTTAGTGDFDADGESDLAELIQGSDPADPDDPGYRISVTVNGLDTPVLDEGSSASIFLELNPGDHAGQVAEYHLWVETTHGIFTYQHPAGFKAGTSSTLSVRAKAAKLDNLLIARIPALGIGEYTLHFLVTVGDLTLQDTTVLQVVPASWQFTEISQSAGLTHTHGYSSSVNDDSLDRQYMAAGAAVGDYDKDGWLDLYTTRGSIGSNLLYHNNGDGTFTDMAAQAGVATTGQENSGATFADYDGDGWPDLLVTGINTTTRLLLFHNNQDGTFTDMTSQAGLPFMVNSMGSSFADIDRDGDLDFFVTHWTADRQAKYLFSNQGNGTFVDISAAAGIPDGLMSDYTANFADINNDQWPDLLISGDFGTSQIFMNQKNSTFVRATSAIINDENGMGGAVGDYDNDGDLDWFVSSIFDSRTVDFGSSRLNWGKSGNRFYQNLGNGTFADATDTTGTRAGGWGWGACMADFDNDGFLDLFHVNGFSSVEGFTTAPFENDASRLFINDQQGSFTERAPELGIADQQQGRGVVCFDFDRDGDLDIFVANNGQRPLLYRNEGLSRHWLQIRVGGEALNSEAIGARVYLSVNGQPQMREVQAGSNFMSQNPVQLHFGLGDAMIVDQIRIVWPLSGTEKVLQHVAADQVLEISQ